MWFHFDAIALGATLRAKFHQLYAWGLNRFQEDIVLVKFNLKLKLSTSHPRFRSLTLPVITSQYPP